jgi:dienelactone hydrolase
MHDPYTMMRIWAQSLLALWFCIASPFADALGEAQSTYSEVFYPSGNLRIQAYLYRPDGNGPFPVVIYNHGSRDGRESASVPFQYIGNMLTRAGYVVLVPERRGYGKSDGPTWRQDVGNDQSMLIARLQAETDDVLAAIDYLRTVPFADPSRIGIMVWSFGGIVTMLAASRSTAFVVAVDQAGGALTWDGNAYVRRAVVAAAEKSMAPTLFMVAKNDRTILSITTPAEIFKTRQIPHRMIIYEPFTPADGTRVMAPGHALFSEQGASVWESDLVQFLGRYLGGKVLEKRDGVAAPKAQQ